MTKDLFGNEIKEPCLNHKAMHRPLVLYWCEKWEEKYGEKYPFTPRDAKHIYTLIGIFRSIKKVQEIIDTFFSDDSSFNAQRGHKLGLLISDLPQYRKRYKEGNGKQKETTPYRGYEEDLDLRRRAGAEGSS